MSRRKVLVALIVTAFVAPVGAAFAQYPGGAAVVDRESMMRQLQVLTAQIVAADQLVAALRADPAAIDAARTTLRAAMGQAHELERTLRLYGPPAIAGSVGYYAPPPPPPPPRAPAQRGRPMPDGDFEALIAAIGAESFSANKIDVLRDAASRHFFLVAQVTRVIDQYTFSADKIAALELMAPRILDRGNTFRVYQAFTFGADKERARQILERR